jgi:hypothetical protein
MLNNIKAQIKEYSHSINEIEIIDKISKIGDQIVAGVEDAKLLPFKYYSIYKSLIDTFPIKKTKPMNTKYQQIIINALERCLKRSLAIFPMIEGRIDVLSDNSESAQNLFTSKYGIMKSSEISNLSGIISAFKASDGGSVWVFGDRYEEYKVDKNGSIFKQLDIINKLGQSVGIGESGLLLFWDKMIRDRKQLDNVFIYSDQQAAYGQLYADSIHKYSMQKMDHMVKNINSSYPHIDMLNIIKQYREKVNNKINIISIQIAGYNPYIVDIMHRGIVCGWNGKELMMMYHMNKYWVENENNMDEENPITYGNNYIIDSNNHGFQSPPPLLVVA